MGRCLLLVRVHRCVLCAWDLLIVSQTVNIHRAQPQATYAQNVDSFRFRGSARLTCKVYTG